MDIIRIPVSKMNADVVFTTAKDLITALTGNTGLPNAPLTNLTTHNATLEQKIDDVTTTKDAYTAALLARDAAADVVRPDLVTIANWAEGISTDPAVLTAGGFKLRSDPSPVHMVQVTGLVATAGDQEGSVDWMCDPQKGAILLLQTSPDVTPRVWTDRSPEKKSHGTISGLPSQSKLWLRVAAKGSNDTGAWSDPALVLVP